MGEAATEEVEGEGGRRPRLRATSLLLVLGLAFSIACWTKLGDGPFVIDRHAFWGQPWRFFAAPLVHRDLLQFLFGMGGFWVLGGALERRIGSGPMLAFVALAALATGFAEQALDFGRTGFTSIDFGMWALLVVGGWRSPALRGATGAVLNAGMGALLLACMALPPLLKGMQIDFALPFSNYGHLAGLAVGTLAALCLDARGRFHQAIVPLSALLLALLGCGATRWRTSWNRGGASVEYVRAGYDALEAGDEPGAEGFLKTALAFDERYGKAWWNLCFVLDRLGRKDEAADACWRAYESMGLDASQLAYLAELQRERYARYIDQQDSQQAFTYATRLAKLDPDDLTAWEAVRGLADELGLDDWYDRADDECKRIDPAQH
ncbi:MAG: rhomboid family intramembrane serine protease [Planctomycetes bacterium]|nr:rhomboid family intramembrane serine protease [Planctomycetota bacterium]